MRERDKSQSLDRWRELATQELALKRTTIVNRLGKENVELLNSTTPTERTTKHHCRATLNTQHLRLGPELTQRFESPKQHNQQCGKCSQTSNAPGDEPYVRVVLELMKWQRGWYRGKEFFGSRPRSTRTEVCIELGLCCGTLHNRCLRSIAYNYRHLFN